VLFVPMLFVAMADRGEGQSFASWILWGALDTILIFSLLERHGNFWVPAGFAVGDFFIAALLLFYRRIRWRQFETIILLLVLACLAAWKFGGPTLATISATVGICVAGLPGLKELWTNPQRNVGNVWAGYTLANGLSFLGGTAMTVEERFAPAAFTLFSMAMFVASRRAVRHENVT
jgi:hypothetical protein